MNHTPTPWNVSANPVDTAANAAFVVHACTTIDLLIPKFEQWIKDYAACAADAYDEGCSQESEVWLAARNDLQEALKLATGE